MLNLYTSGSLTPERFRITWKARYTQTAKSTLCSSSSENVFLRSSQMTHVLLVQGWARWCSQLSYRPPLSTDEKTGSQTTWITQDHTTVRSWADNLKACWSDIHETPESQLPHVYIGVLVLPHYTLVNTSWNNEHYSLWYTVGTHWMFAFPVPCRNLSTGYAKWMWVEWHWIYPIAPTQAFVGDIIWMLLVTPNLSDWQPSLLGPNVNRMNSSLPLWSPSSQGWHMP